VTETTELLDVPASTSRSSKAAGGLSGMVLPDLKALAAQLGIKGTSGMRKGDLVAAISARQNGGNGQQEAVPARSEAPGTDTPATKTQRPAAGATAELPLDLPQSPRRRRAATRPAGAPDAASADGHGGVNGALEPAAPGSAAESADAAPSVPSPADADADGGQGDRNRRNRRNRRDRIDADRVESVDTSPDGSAEGRQNGAAQNGAAQDRSAQDRPAQDRRDGQGGTGQAREQQGRTQTDTRQGDQRQTDNRGQSGQRDQRDQNGQRDDEDGERGGRRNRRFRDRNRRGRDRYAEPGTTTNEPELREDDVLVPVAGILDVLDSYAFIRTSGYLSGPNDVYVSLSQVRKNGLRRGDAVTGAVRAPREGEQQRQKFNALVRLDSVNGLDPEQARNRPEFTKLTPLYPNERLRLETEPHLLTTRVIDLVMPVGKGQRALIVSPPKAGKTMVMQAIANAITTNNPECHLMVVLVDERPEEVTDMQRSVKGEVIASTFDRPPADHTMVAELSIERAKRLVEMGKDVVVLLDSITRLGRAYNLAAPASGRILSGGVDSTALFPPKRFLGAARNIENGGSLTIFASALVETGSAGDTVIFEEFKGTGNAELKLDRRLADKRIFPAIDVDASSTRKEDLLLSPDELAIIVKLRRVLSALEAQPALELVLDRLRKTRNNIEFLMQIQKNTPGQD
jgi:transcription termination factor Rho